MREVVRNNFFISTNKDKLDVSFIQNYLSKKSYWAKNITNEIVKKSINGSICFGLYVNNNKETVPATLIFDKRIGFARVITDQATFAYIADVFVIEKFRGIGLSKWLMEEIMSYPNLQGLRRWLLATRDAHGLYAKYGFLPLDKPELMMNFKPFENYPETDS